MNIYLSSLAVFIGGGAGATLRFLIGHWFRNANFFTASTHWGTFIINLFASIALVLVSKYFDGKATALLLLGTGFCGGWSTYSTFSLEVAGLLQEGRTLEALAYVVASLMVIVGLVFLIHR